MSGDIAPANSNTVLIVVQIPSSTKIRLAYLGKILKEGESLKQQGWQVDHVCNVLVFEQPKAPSITPSL